MHSNDYGKPLQEQELAKHSRWVNGYFVELQSAIKNLRNEQILTIILKMYNIVSVRKLLHLLYMDQPEEEKKRCTNDLR